MTTSITQADYEQLKKIAGRFDTQADSNQRMYQNIGRYVEALQDGGWIGEGSEAFFSEMKNEVLPALMRLTSALEEATLVTRKAIDILGLAEKEAAAPFKGKIDGKIKVTNRVPKNALSSTIPPPRIYIVNGINSQGNVPGARDLNGNIINGDDQSVALEQLLEKHGYNPDEVTSTSAIFRAPEGTSLTGTTLTGTNYGGLLSPIDWLTGGAASTINTVTDMGADAVNKVTGAVATNPVFSSIYGSMETASEYIQGDRGKYTQQVYNEIAQDLRDNPLAPGQTVILMGHSGGGAVTANLSGKLERNLDIDVSGMVTMGSPVSNYDEAGRYAELIVDIRHSQDRIAAPAYTPMIRSEESRVGIPTALHSALSGSPLIPTVANMLGTEAIGRHTGANPNVSTVILDRPVGGISEAHGSYMHDPNVSVDMLRQLNRHFPNMNLQVPALNL